MSTTVRVETTLMEKFCRIGSADAKAIHQAVGTFEFAKALSMEELASAIYGAVGNITGPKIKYYYALVHFNAHHPIRADTTFTGILDKLREENVAIPDVPSRSDLGTTLTIADAGSAANSASTGEATNSTRRHINLDKLTVKEVPKFSGRRDDWLEWKGEALECWSRTVYAIYLEKDRHDDFNERENTAFFNILKGAVKGGSAHYHVLNHPKDGQGAWQELLRAFDNQDSLDRKINSTETAISHLIFDGSSSIDAHLNEFHILLHTLTECNVTWSDAKRKQKLLGSIRAKDFLDLRRDLSKDPNKGFAACVEALAEHEQLQEECETNPSRIRRHHDPRNDLQNKRQKLSNFSNLSPPNEKGSRFPLLPNWFIDTMSQDQKKLFFSCVKAYNRGGTMPTRESVESAQGEALNSCLEKTAAERANNKRQRGRGRQRRNEGNKLRRSPGQDPNPNLPPPPVDNITPPPLPPPVQTTPIQTIRRSLADFLPKSTIRTSPSANAPFRVSFKSSEDDRSPAPHLTPTPPSGPTVGRQRRFTQGATTSSSIVIDSGADHCTVNAAAWRVIRKHSSSNTVRGPDVDSEWRTQHLVDAVSVIVHPDQGPLLLLARNVGLDQNMRQHESLFNPHHLRDSGIDVDDRLFRHNGTQSVLLDDIRVTFSERHGRTLQHPNRLPTPSELENLPCFLFCDAPAGTLRRKIGSIDYAQVLNHLGPRAIDATINATTQLATSPLEAESRVIPRQHRVQRSSNLRQKRLEGRTDTDPFFMGVKSVRGFRIMQLFYHVPSSHISGHLIRKERFASGALADYARRIGAPEILVSDCSQNQKGESWKTITRNLGIDHRFTTPENQNQNHAERAIRDIKRHTTQLLWSNRAPVEFWCYATQFAIDVWNHSAKPSKGFRTPLELLHGHTPDISSFRFSFYQPIWYFEPSTAAPNHPFRPGRFVGLAWDHGDVFTFRIWTEPEDGSKGRELIRNIVRARQIDEPTPTELTAADLERLARLDFLPEPRGQKRSLDNISNADTRAAVQEAIDSLITSRSALDSAPVDQISVNTVPETENTASPANNNPREFDTWLGAPNLIEDDESLIGISVQDDASASPSLTSTQDLFPVATIADSGEESIPDAIDINDTASLGFDPSNDDDIATEILSHAFENGQLMMECKWPSGTTSMEQFRLLKEDQPLLVAEYIDRNKPSRSQTPSRAEQRMFKWAHTFLRTRNRRLRRITRTCLFGLNDLGATVILRKQTSKKKKKDFFAKVIQYGVEVPRNVTHALRLDAENGNSLWRDAIDKEVGALIDLDCFEFRRPDDKPTADFQKTNLRTIFAVKHDGRRKARIVAGGHLIEIADNIRVYSSTVKTLSVRLLDVIADANNLEQLCGDVGNAFVNAYTNEKVFCVAGPEFGDKRGMIVILRKALYGLRSSAERFHAHFADCLRSMDFRPCRHDADVWLRRRDESGYDFICTHVDDFKIIAKDPMKYMRTIQARYSVKDVGPPEYYLGMGYLKNRKGKWSVGCSKYIVSAVEKVERLHGTINHKKTPLPAKIHLELDDSDLLDPSMTQQFQQLIGLLNWAVQLGRFDIAFATSSLSRFCAAPRRGHLDAALHVFGYLKKRHMLRTRIDSSDPIFYNIPDSMIDCREEMKTLYPDAAEEIDPNLPEPLYGEIAITGFVDSDHAHDVVTRRSISGILLMLGRTPVYFASKRQSAIATSTYGAEFSAMRTAVEDVIDLRYALRSLGVTVTTPALLFGDNQAVIRNTESVASQLAKKHVAISYHMVREAIASGIVQPLKIDGRENFADILTKSPGQPIFTYLTSGLFFGGKP